MTGVVYNDDAQIINLIAHRRFANDREQPCAIITVTALS
jgi:Holliday junction resolvase RusA-like endonuclease